MVYVKARRRQVKRKRDWSKEDKKPRMARITRMEFEFRDF